MQVLLDTGPWVALLCRDDAQHDWSRAQWAALTEPVMSCETVWLKPAFCWRATASIRPRR